MQDDVTAVKKSRAASPAPKASKGKDEKEVANGASPSAEKPPKVEKSTEPVKTDKVRICFACGSRGGFIVFNNMCVVSGCRVCVCT